MTWGSWRGMEALLEIRSLFPKIVAALKPGGLLVAKMSLRWNSGGSVTVVSPDPLNRTELPSLVPQLDVLYHQERPVRDRGVVEFVGRKSGNGAIWSLAERGERTFRRIAHVWEGGRLAEKVILQYLSSQPA
jgi:hypothetical protein